MREMPAAFLIPLLAWAASPAAGAQDLPPPPQAGPSSHPASTADPTSPEQLRALLEAAPKRQRMEGAWGARLRSDVVFESAPDRPHELTMTAAFPARTRVELVSADGRMERYQLGRGLFGKDVVTGEESLGPSGYALGPAVALETELDMALRRATFFWPNEGEFVGAGRSRTSKVKRLGVLIATIDEGTGRPTEMTAFGPNGKAAASFRNIQWTEGKRRPWPSKLEFWAGDRLIWRETVTETDTSWTFADPWFLPADLMGKAVGKPGEWSVRMRASKSVLVLSEALPAPIGVDSATTALLNRWLELDAQQKVIGRTLEPEGVLVLDPQRRVTALEFQTAPVAGPSPEGWTFRGGRSTWTVQVGASESPDENPLQAAFGELDRLGQQGRLRGSVRVRVTIEPEEAGPQVSLRQIEADATTEPRPEEAGSDDGQSGSGPSPPRRGQRPR